MFVLLHVYFQLDHFFIVIMCFTIVLIFVVNYIFKWFKMLFKSGILTTWAATARNGPNWHPNRTFGPLGRPGPEMVQNGNQIVHFDNLGGQASKT